MKAEVIRPPAPSAKVVVELTSDEAEVVRNLLLAWGHVEPLGLGPVKANEYRMDNPFIYKLEQVLAEVV